MKTIVSLVAAMCLSGLAAARPLFAFDNGLNDVKDLDAKAALLAELGYQGIGWRPGRTAEMLAALDKHGLKMLSTYVTLKADMEKCPIPADVVSEIQVLKGRDTVVWLNVEGKSTDEVVVPAIRALCDICHRAGLKLALYPHVNCHTDTVASVLRLVEKAKQPNLGVSFNLCHFLKQNDPATLETTLRAAAPKLMVVSINGADTGDTRAMGWDRLIQPLGQGTFDPAPLLRLLDALNYTGPVGLQCYQLQPPAKDHLAASAAAWKKLAAR